MEASAKSALYKVSEGKTSFTQLNQENLMLKDFNLLVTTTRGSEAQACSEMWYLLGETGDNAAEADKTGIVGLITVKTSFAPLEAVMKLRQLLEERPGDFRFSLRIIPIQKVVRANLSDIKQAVAELAEEIGEDETFRVTVEKRHTRLSRKELVEAAAEVVDRKVDLTKPDKIVLIEVAAGLAGVSVLKQADVMSTVKEKSGFSPA